MSTMPCRIALFIAQSSALPCLSMLMQKGLLAGVVLPGHQDGFNQQLEASLNQQQIPNIRIGAYPEQAICEQLTRWETDMVVAFGFSGDVPKAFIEQTRLGFYNMLPVEPNRFAGELPLYWLLRSGESEARVVLERLGPSEGERYICAETDYKIHPLDTYKCVENKVANTAVQCIETLLDNVDEPVRQTEAAATSFSASMPQEKDLYVDFSTMSGKQIVDLARAGNPLFNGCVVVLGETPLSLLQATVVNYQTYGVKPGTICHTGAPDGVIVATLDGAIRLDVIANMDGVYSAQAFCERFQINAGMEMRSAPVKM